MVKHFKHAEEMINPNKDENFRLKKLTKCCHATYSDSVSNTVAGLQSYCDSCGEFVDLIDVVVSARTLEPAPVVLVLHHEMLPERILLDVCMMLSKGGERYILLFSAIDKRSDAVPFWKTKIYEEAVNAEEIFEIDATAIGFGKKTFAGTILTEYEKNLIRANRLLSELNVKKIFINYAILYNEE